MANKKEISAILLDPPLVFKSKESLVQWIEYLTALPSLPDVLFCLDRAKKDLASSFYVDER